MLHHTTEQNLPDKTYIPWPLQFKCPIISLACSKDVVNYLSMTNPGVHESKIVLTILLLGYE